MAYGTTRWKAHIDSWFQDADSLGYGAIAVGLEDFDFGDGYCDNCRVEFNEPDDDFDCDYYEEVPL